MNGAEGLQGVCFMFIVDFSRKILRWRWGHTYGVCGNRLLEGGETGMVVASDIASILRGLGPNIITSHYPKAPSATFSRAT